ncbi:dirigent protein 22-like [Rhodamnia argentea]|uniref:Dirigent protein n=1 Tax=Rhodamnia argentea TaxID=178133 RepID=A0A8B8QKM5_9MYRT|nr:dirigent protein 22-like [Rhodamnia argentea]
MPRKEKLTHLHFFWHDIFTGPNLSAVIIVSPKSNSFAFFGSVSVINDALTIGPDLSSGIIGRAQGLYLSASQEEIAALMAMNLVFTEGEYKGSTLTMLRRNTIFMKVREMPVIGRTSSFRFARGYVHVRTYQFDPKTGLTVVEYDAFNRFQSQLNGANFSREVIKWDRYED